MNQQIADILDRAAELIETKGWTQNAFARACGHPVNFYDRAAECFCVTGAIGAVSMSEPCLVEYQSRMLLARSIGINSSLDIIAWNDNQSRTKDDVIAALK